MRAISCGEHAVPTQANALGAKGVGESGTSGALGAKGRPKKEGRGIEPIPHTQIPWSILFFAVIALTAGVILHATPLGRAIFAIGAGREAAFFAGIRVKRIKFWLFVLSGMLSGFAGVLWTLRFASARYDSGVGMELFVVTIKVTGIKFFLSLSR